MGEDLEDAPKHRWHQFSLLEMLLVTAIIAAVLGIIKFAHMRGVWADLVIVYLIVFNLLWACGRFRRKCIENGIWYPDPVQTESRSASKEAEGQETEQ